MPVSRGKKMTRKTDPTVEFRIKRMEAVEDYIKARKTSDPVIIQGAWDRLNDLRQTELNVVEEARKGAGKRR
jgi:hypothetical protein